MFNLWIARLSEQLDLHYYFMVIMFRCLYIAAEPFTVHAGYCLPFIVTLLANFISTVTLQPTHTHPIFVVLLRGVSVDWHGLTPLKDARIGCMKPTQQRLKSHVVLEWLIISHLRRRHGKPLNSQGKLKVHCHKKFNDQSWPNYDLCSPVRLGLASGYLGTWLIQYAAAGDIICPHQWFEDYRL